MTLRSGARLNRETAEGNDDVRIITTKNPQVRWPDGGIGLGFAATRPAITAWLEATPRQPAGPFYHPIEPLSVDNDLLYHQDTESRADGGVIFIRSRLLNQTGKPIKNARIEIWQANAHGRYNHPRPANSNLPLDPNFFGFGHTLTEPEGHYRFRSIKPAPYSDNLEWLRPPHIHFAVIPEGGTPWLTQMSFAGEALNKRDFLLRNLPSDVVREQVIIDFQTTENAPDARAKLGVFDIALGMPGVTRDKA